MQYNPSEVQKHFERFHQILRELDHKDPSLVGFNLWLRREIAVALNRLIDPAVSWCPRGNILLIPPSNMPLIWLYHFVIGAFFGARFKVRFSDTKASALDRLLVEAVGSQWPEQFECVTWEKADVDRYKAISEASDLRFIWGSDNTCRQLSAVSIKPGGVSVTYPHRTSGVALDCLIDSPVDAAKKIFKLRKLWSGACVEPNWLICMGTPAEVRVWLDSFASVYSNLMTSDGESLRLYSDALLQNQLLMSDICPDFLSSAVKFWEVTEICDIEDFETEKKFKFGMAGFGVVFMSEIGLPEAKFPDVFQSLGLMSLADRSLVFAKNPLRIRRLESILNFESDWEGVDLYSLYGRGVSI